MDDLTYWKGPEDLPFPDHIKAWRASQGLTSRQAAVALGLSPRTLEPFERGRRCPYEGALRLAMEWVTLQGAVAELRRALDGIDAGKLKQS
jgi:DNA-binding transcriptional regulator YiaG